MEIILAKTAGFCFGVKRAVDTVYSEIENESAVYTYGPIIHNEEVVKDLESKGVTVLSEEMLSDGQDFSHARAVIRSHGVGRNVYDRLGGMGFLIVDATCPFVKKIHKIVDEESSKGSRIIIVGDKSHPEVQGIMGWCSNEPEVIESLEEAEKIDVLEGEKVVLVAQTTFNSIIYKDLVEFFRKKDYNVCVYNTICNATWERQEEARLLAASVDVMIVIGGTNS